MEMAEYKKMAQMQQVHWWYKARRELVRDLAARIGIAEGVGKDIVDIGCGTGEGAYIFPKAATLTGIDPSEQALCYIPQPAYTTLTQGSAEQLPYADSSFDVALLIDVLEHVKDDTRALKEAYRVLRPNGSLLITVPAYEWLWSDHDRAVWHQRRYVRSELTAQLKKAGFQVELASYYMTILLPFIALVRLLGRFFPRRQGSDFFMLPRVFNVALYKVCRVEGVVIARGLTAPYGSSIVVIVRRPARAAAH
jgi:ubiquinone/menaquinone biosynthesis C-methylase UbiE